MSDQPDKAVRWIDEAVGLLRESGAPALFRVPETDLSMIPTLAPGSALAISFSSDEPDRGDVILFRQAGYFVAHRLLGAARDREGRPCLRTRGDGIVKLDPPLPRREVVGRAVAVEGPDGWRSLEGAGARVYALAFAYHDLFWAALGVVVSRSGPIHRLVGALDRSLLRVAHAALFRVLHARIDPPVGSRLTEPGAGPG